MVLFDKKKYILHYNILKLYLNLGLKLEKIQRVRKFDQFSWLTTTNKTNNEFNKGLG